MNRREFLQLAALPVAQLLDGPALSQSPGRIVPSEPGSANGIELVREWSGPLCRSRVVNRRKTPVRIKEVVLFDVQWRLPPETSMYGEGFQMLTQTGGTLAAPWDLSQYSDAKHYRLPVTEGARAFYGLLTVTPPAGETLMFAFTSCSRFSGRFEIFESPSHRMAIVVDTENLTLDPGETWDLEELMVASGDRSQGLADLAERLAVHHPPLRASTTVSRSAPPTGWCSWYCFGPTVTAPQVLENLDAIANGIPSLRYVQIDDGYQRAMGDWLDTGAAFGGNIRTVLTEIRRRGFEPAIWVAPFVAEEKSAVFTQHPDWFIKDAQGAPLRADRVTFGGWRRGPWFALDGTHPEARGHLERVFKTMRAEWGCTYFKLDANFWGAMHGGRFHDPRATRIDAYRQGMHSILRGAGDSFILGCNHPIWPSLGLLHGSRSSNDIKRSWDRIKTTGFQNLQRNWQNGRLWWNDPDAIVLASDLSDAECQFHATVIHASGGMILSGDDLTKLPAARAAMLKKILPPTGIAAVFDDASLRFGTMMMREGKRICLFNWDDMPDRRTVRVSRTARVTDFWTGEAVDAGDGNLTLTLPGRSARLLEVVDRG